MEKATLFLRKKGLNHDFRLKGSDFNGTLLELLREYNSPKCRHEEKTMQGDGFTYTICSKCGKDLG